MWRLAEDTLDERDLEALAGWLGGSPQLTQGPLVTQFEHQWSEWLGCADSVMVSSGSTANLALITALTQVGGNERLRIGASAVTWPTNITPGLMLGHELVLLDINPRTLGIDSTIACEVMKSGEIDVLFVTHLLGFNALTEEMVRVAGEQGVILLEDSCEAHGARHGQVKVGTVGLGSSFSFYFGHHMSTIEGGMISSGDREFTDRLRLIRNHGMARSSVKFDDYARRNPGIDRGFLFVLAGMNYRSTDVNAFLGLRQLNVIDDRIQHRNSNLKRFVEQAPEWIWTDFETKGISSFALPLIANDASGHEVIRRVVDRLEIESRPVVAGNLTRQPFLEGASYRAFPEDLPTADHIHGYGLYVGNGHHVSGDMVDRLCEELNNER